MEIANRKLTNEELDAVVEKEVEEAMGFFEQACRIPFFRIPTLVEIEKPLTQEERDAHVNELVESGCKIFDIIMKNQYGYNIKSLSELEYQKIDTESEEAMGFFDVIINR